MLEPTAGTAAGILLDEAAETAAATNEALLLAAETAEPDAAEPEAPATEAPAEEASTKPETGKEDATIEGNGDGNGQVPPGQTEDEDGTIVNPGGNVAPGLNRGEHIDKPENPNKPDKPENPGTEDSTDSKVDKANSGTHQNWKNDQTRHQSIVNDDKKRKCLLKTVRNTILLRFFYKSEKGIPFFPSSKQP